MFDLNAQQREAVTAPYGPVLVLAGPGSGKTRVLTHRIAWLLDVEEIPAWQLLAVTFTNKAAQEMHNRLDEMVGVSTARNMTIGTFHGTCARILRREAESAGFSNDYLIFDADDQLAVMKDVVKEMGLDDKRYRPKALLNAVSRAKNDLCRPLDYPVETYYDEIVIRAYTRYQEALRRSNGLDFDDLLMETAHLLRTDVDILNKYRNRYRCLLVDEFQDTNKAQYEILKHLSQEHRQIFVVADEDQSIYSWRGADYHNIMRLREDFPKLCEYILEENYRSTQTILNGARAVIARNTDRTPKQLFTSKGTGDPITLHEAYDEKEESSYVARQIEDLLRNARQPGDIAVMYRTNAQSRALEETLIAYNIPYRLIGGTRFYARKEIKDVLAFLRLAQNPDDDVSFQRVVNEPTRGIGARTLSKIAEQAKASEMTYYRASLALLEQRVLRKRTHWALQAFVTLVMEWNRARESLPVAALMDNILADTGYEEALRDQTEEGESRWENILSLRAVAAEFPHKSLIDFLTEIALVADVDALDKEVEAVTLLTLHSAKGLEYPVVFITGLEEGILPHSRSMESPDEIAEERRLLYVGITRAKECLYLTRAFRRGWGWGRNDGPTEASRFLEDLPDSVLSKARKAKTAGESTPQWGASPWRSAKASSAATARRIAPHFTFQQGQRIQHAHYGEGMVLESRMEGHDEIVSVIFTGIGIKQLLVGVAPMEALPEH